MFPLEPTPLQTGSPTGRGDPTSCPVPWGRLSKAEWKGGTAWGNLVSFKPRGNATAEEFALQGDVPPPSLGHCLPFTALCWDELSWPRYPCNKLKLHSAKHRRKCCRDPSWARAYEMHNQNIVTASSHTHLRNLGTEGGVEARFPRRLAAQLSRVLDVELLFQVLLRGVLCPCVHVARGWLNRQLLLCGNAPLC